MINIGKYSIQIEPHKAIPGLDHFPFFKGPPGWVSRGLGLTGSFNSPQPQKAESHVLLTSLSALWSNSIRGLLGFGGSFANGGSSATQPTVACGCAPNNQAPHQLPRKRVFSPSEMDMVRLGTEFPSADPCSGMPGVHRGGAPGRDPRGPEPEKRDNPTWVARSVSGNTGIPNTCGENPSDRLILSHTHVSKWVFVLVCGAGGRNLWVELTTRTPTIERGAGNGPSLALAF